MGLSNSENKMLLNAIQAIGRKYGKQLLVNDINEIKDVWEGIDYSSEIRVLAACYPSTTLDELDKSVRKSIQFYYITYFTEHEENS